MENSDTRPHLIQIHPNDNVGVLSRSVQRAEPISYQDWQVLAAADFALGHKFALADIPAGAKVMKYGVSIGSTTGPVKRGEHVHLHNLKSDYLPTYTLESERNFQG